jgi:hypothetical protein
MEKRESARSKLSPFKGDKPRSIEGTRSIKAKRSSPTKDKYRLAENFKRKMADNGESFSNQEDFNTAYDSYMKDKYQSDFTEKQRGFLWESYKKSEGYKSAVAAQAQGIKKSKKAAYKEKPKHEYAFFIKTGKTSSFGYKSTYTYKGKERTVYRDDKGRFGKLIKQ